MSSPVATAAEAIRYARETYGVTSPMTIAVEAYHKSMAPFGHDIATWKAALDAYLRESEKTVSTPHRLTP